MNTTHTPHPPHDEVSNRTARSRPFLRRRAVRRNALLPATAVDAFAGAEHALRSAGLGFTVVETSEWAAAA